MQIPDEVDDVTMNREVKAGPAVLAPPEPTPETNAENEEDEEYLEGRMAILETQMKLFETGMKLKALRKRKRVSAAET